MGNFAKMPMGPWQPSNTMKNRYIQICYHLARRLKLIRHLEATRRHALLINLANSCACFFNKVGERMVLTGEMTSPNHTSSASGGGIMIRGGGGGLAIPPMEHRLWNLPHKTPGVTTWKLDLHLTRKIQVFSLGLEDLTRQLYNKKTASSLSVNPNLCDLVPTRKHRPSFLRHLTRGGWELAGTGIAQIPIRAIRSAILAILIPSRISL